MRKKVLTIVLTIAMCTMMSATAFAASSTSNSSSSESSGDSGSSNTVSAGSTSVSKKTTEAARGNINTDSVFVAAIGADGSVQRINLTQYTKQVENAVISVAANSAAAGVSAGEAVSSVMTNPASEMFKATINALGGNIRLVNTGGYKVVAAAADSSGKTIASVGTIRGVTKYALVILTAVNADGTVEIIEGTVDPVTLQVMGVFSGVPATVTVSVVMPQ